MEGDKIAGKLGLFFPKLILKLNTEKVFPLEGVGLNLFFIILQGRQLLFSGGSQQKPSCRCLLPLVGAAFWR